MNRVSPLVTVLVPTSYIPTHPSVRIIKRAVRSIRTNLPLAESPLVICCDGPPEDHHEQDHYAEYKHRLRNNSAVGESRIVELSQHVGLPGVLLEGFRHVSTPLVLVFQHDNMVVRSVNFEPICRALLRQSLRVNHVRLNHRINLPMKSDSVLKPFHHPEVKVPLLRTSSWSDMPHFARTRYYRDDVLPLLQPSSDSRGVESKMIGPFRKAIEEYGFEAAHLRYGTFVYGRLGDPPVIRHLDGRRRGLFDHSPAGKQ